MKQGWEIKKLGEVCKVIAGQSPEGKFYNSDGKGLPFYQGKKEYGEKYIGEPTTWTTYTTKEAEADDILMSVRAPVGPINFSTQKICIGRGLAAIRASKLIDKEFLFNFLLKHENEIIGNAGAVFNSINKAQIEAIEIPLPPLPEQQRIVSILDEAFAAIAKAKDNAEQNLRNAKELFDSYLQGVFEGIKENGQLTLLANYLDLITYGFTNPMPATDEGPYMVTAKNVKGGIVDYETSRRTSQVAFDTLITDKSRPKKGDVLLTKDGTLGRLAVVEKANMCINQSVALLRPNNQLDSYYLKELLSSQFYQKLMIEQAGGATIKHIYITRVDKMLVPVPPINQQQSIVQKLDALSAETKKLEAIYQQKINDLEEMKKSILQKAFSGELKT